MASDQSVETYAMCNCGQLSNNLEECERCGSKLTEALYCYGADPPAKRSRLDDRRDEGASERTSENASNKNSSEPVPQALFAAAAAEPVSGAQPVPVPQALYVNKINNKEVSSSPFNNSQPGTPPVSVARSSPASTAGSGSIPAQPQQVYMNIQNCQFSKLPGTCGTLVQPVSQPIMSNSASTTPTLAGVSQASRATTVNNNANYTSNFQPNVMTVPPAAPLNGGGIDTSAAVTRVMTNGPSVQNQNGATAAMDKQPQDAVVHFNAFQVRLGRVKFIPSVPIEVKSTGILMALQGDVKAPVLINARAITMCKVNWSSSFPVILVYLEGSCIRQLRNIFSISLADFNPEGTKDIHRRITIFPNFATTAASLSSIKNMFSSMQESDGTTNYRLVVTEINEEQAIDVLLDNVPQKIPRQPSKASTPSNSSPKPDAVSTTSQRTAPSTKPTSHPTQSRLGRPPLTANPTPPMPAASIPASIPPNLALTTPQQGLVTGHQVPQQMQINRPPVMSTMTQQQQMLMAQRHPPPSYHAVNRPNLPRMDIPRSRYPTQQSVVPPNTVAPNNKFPPRIPLGPGQHPSVVLPTNPQGWDHLRRTLSSGSIYQVQEANQPPQFCIWSGTEFVKCLVKETEVVLESTRISIGTLAGTPRQQIRVHGGGVYISLQINDGRNFQLHIPIEDIQPSYMCVHKKCPSIFLYTTSSGSEKIRKTLNMPAYPNSSMAKYYNPSSSDEKYKHIIIMLKAVTADQKDALSKMKLPSNNQPVIKEIHYMAAIDIINKINESTERGKNRPVQVNQGQESDDDDVIMLAEEVGIKCPITLTIMKHPVKNTVCNHNYEKQAILEHIENKKGSARCPCAGCGNRVPIKREDLVDNIELKKYIENSEKKS